MTGLIVALDNPDLSAAEDLAKEIGGRVYALKVGLTLFTAHGPEAVRRIGAHGPVFCDLKFHDIPHQVGLAAAELVKLGVWMFTIHSSGGSEMVAAAVNAAGSQGPLVAAVTILTSLGDDDVTALGFNRAPADQVSILAKLAVAAGAGALVCSGHELGRLRRELGDDLVLVVPGIRPAGGAAGDQSRIMTPAEAARLGASHVVIGRPITDAPDPVQAVEGVLEELKSGAKAPTR